MSEVKLRFKPSAVVCQCGVDTLAGDPMASFNLTQYSIGECVRYLMEWNLPLLLLGGGGSDTAVESKLLKIPTGARLASWVFTKCTGGVKLEAGEHKSTCVAG